MGDQPRGSSPPPLRPLQVKLSVGRVVSDGADILHEPLGVAWAAIDPDMGPPPSTTSTSDDSQGQDPLGKRHRHVELRLSRSLEPLEDESVMTVRAMDIVDMAIADGPPSTLTIKARFDYFLNQQVLAVILEPVGGRPPSPMNDLKDFADVLGKAAIDSKDISQHEESPCGPDFQALETDEEVKTAGNGDCRDDHKVETKEEEEGAMDGESCWRRPLPPSSWRSIRRVKRKIMPVSADRFYGKSADMMWAPFRDWLRRMFHGTTSSTANVIDSLIEEDKESSPPLPPPPICRVFPKQELAFRYHDSCRGWEALPALPSKRQEFSDPMKIWREGLGRDLRLFAFESPGDGKRNFCVCDFGLFLTMYKRMDPHARHVYEIIREGYPCRLYFDVEYEKAYNADVDGDRLIEIWIAVVAAKLEEMFGIKITSNDVLDLDSSTPIKYSHHLIVHLPGSQLFRSNVHVGRFVQTLLSQASPGSEPSGPESELWVKKADGKPVFFVDTGVYTRNRCFRMIWSTKYGKTTPLTLAHINRCSPGNRCTMCDQHPPDSRGEEVEWLLASLVVPAFPCGHTPPCSMLEVADDANQLPLKFGYMPTAQGGNSNLPGLASFGGEFTSSPFPALDDFLKTQINKGGVQGTLRSWQYSYRAPIGDPDPSQQQQQAPPPATSLLTYHIGRNRWCENIGRAHKSNHTMMVVDLRRGVFYQKCHDPDCRSYRSPPFPIPPSIMPSDTEINQVELDAALEEDIAANPGKWC